MRKVHITLIGGQLAPVYIGICAAKPDKIVYVYSSVSKSQMDVIQKEIERGGVAVSLEFFC